MKKTYFFAFMAMGFAALAQSPKARVEAQRTADNNEQRPARSANVQSTYTGTETVVYSEDFANGIPASWDNTGGLANGVADIDSKWEYRGTTTTPSNATGSRGAYAGPASTGQLPIQSATAANGFVVFDSDFLDNNGVAGNFCGTGALACAPHVANLETGVINLVGHPTVDLVFTQYYRRFAGPGGVQTVPATYLDFSTDGGQTWTGNVALNASIAVNSATPRNSAVAVSPQNRRRSTARLERQICGKRNVGSVSASSYEAAGAPVMALAGGLYASGFGLNGRLRVLSTDSKPVSTPLLPIWFEIHT
jgi:hypothetical protein